MNRFLLIILSFCLILASFSSAHDPIIIHNIVEIKDNYIAFHNNGSISILVGENNYEALVRKHIIFKNNNENCTYGKFEVLENAYNGFNVNITCKSPIGDIVIEDDFFSNSTQVENKIYNIVSEKQTRQYIGIGKVRIEIGKVESSKANIFATYFLFGVDHILSGIDHIFFIIGFLIIASSFLSVIKNISGFTLSHSFTLTLAATGILIISSKIVEPIIAISIIIVGLLGIFNKLNKHLSGFWLIFGFGLFHGLGFAGAIADVGFPKIGFISSLIGFNLGVEAGQLIVVLLVYPILHLINKYNKDRYPITKAISIVIVITAAFWFIQRII